MISPRSGYIHCIVKGYREGEGGGVSIGRERERGFNREGEGFQ